MKYIKYKLLVWFMFYLDVIWHYLCTELPNKCLLLSFYHAITAAEAFSSSNCKQLGIQFAWVNLFLAIAIILCVVIQHSLTSTKHLL